MSQPPSIPVFDGHNDTLAQIRLADGEEERSFLERSDRGHIDLPRAREGGLAGGFFAIFTPNPSYQRSFEPVLDDEGREVPGAWRVDLPPKLDRRKALTFTVSVISDLLRLQEASEGGITLATTAEEVRRCRAEGRVAAIAHIEGAEAIDTKLEALDVLYEAGLRSIGLVWSRPNAFAHGVPFDFPSSPDRGPGLTAHGRRLVEACNRKGVLVDLSHLNEKGFWDVAEIVRHARYVADRIGVEHVGLGSDFDGAKMPEDLGDVTGLPRLLETFADAGFDKADVRRIAHENWERVLEQTL